MNLDELPHPNTKEWQGINFRVESPLPIYRVLIATNTYGDLNYQSSIKPIDDLNRFAIGQIEALKLPQIIASPPIYTVSIVPETRFLQATGIPENFKDWATVCSRSVWHTDKKEDTVITSSTHAKKINFQPNGTIDLTEEQLDIIREAIHEHLPTMKDKYFPFVQASALPFAEAIDESVPFYNLRLGKKMPRFTKFRTELKNVDILTVEELWNGFSRHSSNPVATNRAYGSALLLGVGLLRRLENIDHLSPNEALSVWIDTMSRAKDGRDTVKQIADRIRIGEQILWSGKVVQKEGQEIIRREFLPKV
ncbi:hypothetical protein HY948_01665 [Candidatus Gottesmanbacteria bacterium]|nr:hypothetical protein [Candidatus Gottesmanbacteria bacterium]